MPVFRDGKSTVRKVTPVERFFTRSPYGIVTLVLRINGNVSEDMLRQAVSKVQQRHTLLRARIIEDEQHTQWFTFDDVQDIPITIVPRGNENDWIDIHTDFLKLPFEFETRPAIRFVLVNAPDTSELIIICHHIICDGLSLAYLARDLMVVLGDPTRDVEVLPPLPVIDLENLPKDVSQPGLVKTLIQRMNKKWAEERTYFDQEDYRILTESYSDTFHHNIIPIDLSEDETNALVSRCRDEEVTLNSALTTAFMGAQRIIQGDMPYHQKVVVAANLRERIPQSPEEGMGMYAGGVELKFTYNHKKGFWANARTFQKKFQSKFTNKNLFRNILNWLYLEPSILDAIHFKKLGGIVPPTSPRYEKLYSFSQREDVVLRLLKQDKLESLDTKHWGTAVTNLGRLDFPTTYGMLEIERMFLQPGGGIPLVNVNLVLAAVTCSGKLSLLLEHAEEAIDTLTMEKIRDKAMELLRH